MLVTINGEEREVTSPSSTPLLYVLRNELDVMTPKFGCGLAQCGACSILIDGEERRACITPLAMAEGREVTTVEGLPARWAEQKGLAKENVDLHPVQKAWDDEQVPQCGICQYGMMIKVTELLEANPDATDDDVKEALTTSGPSPHLCRCASYAAILDGARKAARIMRGEEA